MLAVAMILLWPRAGAAQVCVGDCDGNRTVEVTDLILGVSIALGFQPVSMCQAFANARGVVDVAQLVQAVNNAIDGCAPAPSATETATPTPTTRPTESPSATPSPTGSPLSPQAACAALSGSPIGGAAIQSASLVAATTAHPEYCKVLGTIPPRLNFEIRLPTSWSGRALFMGGSGLDGLIPAPEALLFNPSIAAAGYVTIGTDSGHQASPFDGSWALDDPAAVENFASLGTHTVLGAARAIIAARYGRAAQRTYFFGASQGGREGLIAAQRWPDDFDGIVALEPVYDFTALVLAENNVAQQAFSKPGGRLDAGKVTTLAHAELDACDGLDGIEDGIISNLAACHFDPTVLRCAGADSDQCLTDAEIDTVNAVHGELAVDFALAHDVRSYPGWPIGHEDTAGSLSGWLFWIVGSSADPSSSAGFTLSDQTLRFLIVHDAGLDTLQFTAAAHTAELVSFSTLADATDPDLSRFAARGGKLILWHGLADYAASALSTMRYYQRVVSSVGGQDAADRFIRLYTSPGVGHLNDGPGAGTTDFLSALTAWVETGAAPGDLVAAKLNPGTATNLLTRPLCRHPTYPRYEGGGDPHDASSFHCAPPS